MKIGLLKSKMTTSKKQLPSLRPSLALPLLLAATSTFFLLSPATAKSSAASSSPLSSRICSNCDSIFLVIPRGGHAAELGANTSYASTADGSGSSSRSSSDNGSNKNFGGKITKVGNNYFLPPLIDIPSMILALRLTCEANRRLFLGTFPSDDNRFGIGIKNGNADQKRNTNAEKYNIGSYPKQHQRLSSTVSSMGIPPVIPAVSNEERAEERRGGDSLTVFHSLIPWKGSSENKKNRGGDNIKSSSLNSTSTTSTPRTATSDSVAVSSEGTSELSGAIQYAAKSKGGEFANENHTSRRGIARWGPDLDVYMNALLSSVGLDPNEDHLNPSSQNQQQQIQTLTQKILLQTILFIEKSTSLDTPRIINPRTGQPYFPPVPYLMPRTVHRLILTAFSMSVKRNLMMGSTIDVSVEDVSHILRTAANSLFRSSQSVINVQCDVHDKKNMQSQHEISEFEMQQMEHWMIHALGGDPSQHYHHYHQNYHSNYHSQQQHQEHWQITPEEMTTFLYKWGETFYPQRLRMYEEKERHRASSLMERWDMFWRWSHHHQNNINNNNPQHQNNYYQQQHRYHQSYHHDQHHTDNFGYNHQYRQNPAPQYHQTAYGYSETNIPHGWNSPREDHGHGNDNIYDGFTQQHQSLHNSDASKPEVVVKAEDWQS